MTIPTITRRGAAAVAATLATAAAVAAPVPAAAAPLPAAGLAPAVAEYRAATGVTQAQAQAAVLGAYSRCSAYGRGVCLFSEPFYGGRMLHLSSRAGYGCVNLSHWGWGGRADSAMVVGRIGWLVSGYRCWHERRGPSQWVAPYPHGGGYSLGYITGRDRTGVSSVNLGG